MSSTELARLWKLHEIDAGILDIQQRAASFNPAKEATAKLKDATTHEAEIGGKYRALHAEQTDLELANQTLQDKIDRITKELFGGTVVSSREVATFEREIESLKKQKSGNEDRLLELLESIPPAKKLADLSAAELATAKKEYANIKQQAATMRLDLETRYADLTKARPQAKAGIGPNMLNKYESIRVKHGTGMSKITKKSCGACGMSLAEKVIISAQEGRLVQCDACHRILYFTEGLI